MKSGDAFRHNLPLNEGQKPVFTLAGLALPLNEWRSFHRDYHALKLKFFKSEIDKSSKSVQQWEFKGNRAIGPRNANSERIKLFFSYDLPEKPSFAEGAFKIVGIIPAQGSRYWDFGPADKPLNWAQADEIQRGKAKLYIFGYVSYTDNFWFLGSHTVGFCGAYNPNAVPIGVRTPPLNECGNSNYVYYD